MTSRITLFLSTHGQPMGCHAFTIANDDHPDRPASAATVRGQHGLRLAEAAAR